MNEQHTSLALDKAFSQAAHEISTHFMRSSYELYAVGGAVRDALIGREVHDVDFATNALPKDVMRICRRTIATGLQHGTITVLWKGESFEITTYRTDEGYSNFRQPDSVSFTGSLACDLARRDFTINAVALDLITGALHDPYGGKADIARRLIRCVGRPVARFTEDALRMMRCVRFATTLAFAIDQPTLHAIKKCAHLISHISKERIAQELQKILRASHAHQGYVLLQETRLYGFIFSEDVMSRKGISTDCARKYADDDTALLLRAIATVPLVDNEKRREMLAHAALFLPKGVRVKAVVQEAADMAHRAYTALKLSKKDLMRIVTLLRSNGIKPCKRNGVCCTRRLRLLITLIGLEHAYDLVAFHMAQRKAWTDSQGMEQLRMCGEYIKQCMTCEKSVVQTPAHVCISGQAIAECVQRKPGKWLGDVKKTLMRWVSVHPENNDPRVLLEYVKRMKIACGDQ